MSAAKRDHRLEPVKAETLKHKIREESCHA